MTFIFLQEFSLLSPSFVVPAVTAAIVFLTGYAKLSGQVSANEERQKAHEAKAEKRFEACDESLEDLRGSVERHVGDHSRHVNQGEMAEFRKRIEEKFDTQNRQIGDLQKNSEKSLEEIKRTMERTISKIDDFIHQK